MLNIADLRQQQIPLAAEPRSPVPFHILMKPIGPACNLACRYCLPAGRNAGQQDG
ncbi:Anaerobic sulfatase-maturating enzyme [Klebsiella pneumoniae]|nr:Anaerobic sulfatase-maturating enzyme [Klebsiella pneumoniae]